MEAPKIYYEWVQVLNCIKEGKNDKESLALMNLGQLEQQDGVYTRFMARLLAVINTRFTDATSTFQKAIANLNDESETAIQQALGKLAGEMSFIPKLAKLPVLKSDDSAKMLTLITDQINRIGESLVKSAKTDRTGRLTSILKSKGFKVD